jgi:hypothetical protein
MPTRHGTTPRPDFQIIDWRGGTPSTPTDQQQIEEFVEYADESDAPPDDETDFPFGQPTIRSAT